MTVDTHSVLVAARDRQLSSLAGAMLIAPVFETRITGDFNEARRLAAERTYNIILSEYADGAGADFAADVSGSLSTVLLLTPQELYEETSYRVEGFGIITLATPIDNFAFYSSIKAAIAVQYKVQAISSQTVKLKIKMEEIRLVNRAKMLLMQFLKMTEQEAHRYIEKEAMDRGMKKTSIADEVIRTYG